MQDKTILITGCSSGIGLTTALALKNRGYTVFATARKADDIERLRAQGLESVRLDVTNASSMDEALATILAKTNGKLFALFNNAGFAVTGAVEDLTTELDRSQFETNVFGAMALTRRVLPIMRKQGYGRIIQNSSMLGYMTMPLYSAYAASKHALEAYSSTLRQELIGTSIYVSMINPGPIKTNLRQHAYGLYQHTVKKNQTGLFKTVYERVEKNYFNPESANTSFSAEPTIAIKSIIRALESSRPKNHYYVGMPAKVFCFLKWLLPDSTFDWLVNKIR